MKEEGRYGGERNDKAINDARGLEGGEQDIEEFGFAIRPKDTRVRGEANCESPRDIRTVPKANDRAQRNDTRHI